MLNEHFNLYAEHFNALFTNKNGYILLHVWFYRQLSTDTYTNIIIDLISFLLALFILALILLHKIYILKMPLSFFIYLVKKITTKNPQKGGVKLLT